MDTCGPLPSLKAAVLGFLDSIKPEQGWPLHPASSKHWNPLLLFFVGGCHFRAQIASWVTRGTRFPIPAITYESPDSSTQQFTVLDSTLFPWCKEFGLGRIIHAGLRLCGLVSCLSNKNTCNGISRSLKHTSRRADVHTSTCTQHKYIHTRVQHCQNVNEIVGLYDITCFVVIPCS